MKLCNLLDAKNAVEACFKDMGQPYSQPKTMIELIKLVRKAWYEGEQAGKQRVEHDHGITG